MDVLTTVLGKDSACGDNDKHDPIGQYVGTRSIAQQTVISVVLGLSAFLTFCVS